VTAEAHQLWQDSLWAPYPGLGLGGLGHLLPQANWNHHPAVLPPGPMAPSFEAPMVDELNFEEEEELQSVVGKGRSRVRTRGEGTRFWCSFHLAETYLKLNVVPAIIGRHGKNTRSIFEATSAKIRVRGRGSGHKEMSTGKEAPTGLMVTVSAKSDNGACFQEAVRMTGALLRQTQTKLQGKMLEHEVPMMGELCCQIVSNDGTHYRLDSEGVLVSIRDEGKPQMPGTLGPPVPVLPPQQATNPDWRKAQGRRRKNNLQAGSLSGLQYQGQG